MPLWCVVCTRMAQALATKDACSSGAHDPGAIIAVLIANVPPFFSLLVKLSQRDIRSHALTYGAARQIPANGSVQ